MPKSRGVALDRHLFRGSFRSGNTEYSIVVECGIASKYVMFPAVEAGQTRAGPFSCLRYDGCAAEGEDFMRHADRRAQSLVKGFIAFFSSSQ